MGKEYTHEENRAWLESLHGIPAGAVVLLEGLNDQLLVVKATYRRYWTPPGGVVDEGESPKQAAIREVKEEVGLEIAAESVTFIGVQHRKSDMRGTFQFIFGAPISQAMADMIVIRESEIEAYAFVTKEQVKHEDRLYSPAVVAWAADTATGYNELVLASA